MIGIASPFPKDPKGGEQKKKSQKERSYYVCRLEKNIIKVSVVLK